MQMQGVRQTSPSDWSDSIRTKGSDNLQHTVWSRWYINVATFQWTGENVSSARLTPAHLSQETDLQENHSSSIFHHGGELVFCSLHRSPENPSIITNKQTECTHTLTHTERSQWEVSMAVWQLSTADRDFFISHQSLGWIKDIDWLRQLRAALDFSCVPCEWRQRSAGDLHAMINTLVSSCFRKGPRLHADSWRPPTSDLWTSRVAEKKISLQFNILSHIYDDRDQVVPGARSVFP